MRSSATVGLLLIAGVSALLLAGLAEPGLAQPLRVARSEDLGLLSDEAQWHATWTGQATGSVEVRDGHMRVHVRYDAGLKRQGHTRLTLYCKFPTPRDLSQFTGLMLRFRALRPAPVTLMLHLYEGKGVRYRCDPYAKTTAVGEGQTLLTRFDTDFRWDFETSNDPDGKLNLDHLVGLGFMVTGIGEGTDCEFEISDLAAYVQAPPATTNLLRISLPGGPMHLLPPGTALPAPLSLSVKVDKLEPSLRAPLLRWRAADAWHKEIASGEAKLARQATSSAPVSITVQVPGYAELNFELVEGEKVLASRRYCLSALPLPDAEDAAPRENSIFGLWPGGWGLWIKLGVKWARTYAQPWDFEPLPDGGFRWIRKGADGTPAPFPPTFERALNDLCFFRGMPKWLSSRPERVDFRKFPPKDWDTYARFISYYVDQLKDQIHVWEVWNEPVPYAYWMGTVEQVVKLHEVTYKAIKRVQPDSIVLGPCPYRIRLDFTRRFWELGGWRWIDAASVHAYMAQPDPQFVEDLTWLRQIMRQHGGEKDIWVTEVGWDTRRRPEIEQARYLVQTYVLGLSQHVHTIIWHMNWDFADKMLRGGHGLIRYNHQPKPGLVAYATLIRTLEGAQFLRGPSADATGARVFEFTKSGRRVWVAWAQKEGLVWQAPAGVSAAFDLFGKPVPLPADRHLTLGPDPIYLLAETTQR
ncbi:MAG: hypothetical protein J7M26_00370 [Armatimonadetes bacterium]|nr:hypothetical protein [Armatimonadota bacterium]